MLSYLGMVHIRDYLLLIEKNMKTLWYVLSETAYKRSLATNAKV